MLKAKRMFMQLAAILFILCSTLFLIKVAEAQEEVSNEIMMQSESSSDSETDSEYVDPNQPIDEQSYEYVDPAESYSTEDDYTSLDYQNNDVIQNPKDAVANVEESYQTFDPFAAAAKRTSSEFFEYGQSDKYDAYESDYEEYTY